MSDWGAVGVGREEGTGLVCLQIEGENERRGKKGA